MGGLWEKERWCEEGGGVIYVPSRRRAGHKLIGELMPDCVALPWDT